MKKFRRMQPFFLWNRHWLDWYLGELGSVINLNGKLVCGNIKWLKSIWGKIGYVWRLVYCVLFNIHMFCFISEFLCILQHILFKDTLTDHLAGYLNGRSPFNVAFIVKSLLTRCDRNSWYIRITQKKVGLVWSCS